MSTARKKPVKNIRDIFEATDQAHSTEDYRKKMVDHWISYQHNEPASLHEPTILESNATQKLRPPSSSKSHRNDMYNGAMEEQQMKKRKHDHNNVLKFDDFDMQQPQQFGLGIMDDPFFEFDMRNNSNNNNNNYFDNNRMLNDPLPPSKTQNRTVKQSDTTNKLSITKAAAAHHRHHHQSQGHAMDVHSARKRQKSSNQHIYSDDDHVDLVDFQFDFDVDHTEKPQRENKKNEDMHGNRRMHRKNIDTDFASDQFIDFDLLANALDDDAKNIKQPTPQFIYKRFKERSYAELMGTTPMAWQDTDKDLHKRDAIRGENNDGFLFKKPATVTADTVGVSRKAIEKFDWHDRGRGSRGNNHYEQHLKNRPPNQQYVISHEIEKFVPKSKNTNNKDVHVLKMDQNHTAITSTQPNTFYIKCNNLVIKHD